jgi:molybdopterin molybdotransferase
MDGYAVRFDDIEGPLDVVGESQAGQSFDGILEPGQAVRIFTGAPMVDGADTVVIQEYVIRKDDQIIVNNCTAAGGNIRAAGSDFMAGECLIQAHTKIDARHIALIAAGNVAWFSVYKQSKVAILSTGDELLEVGSDIGPYKIVNSNVPLFMALVIEHGGIPINLGTAKDTVEDVKAKIALVKDVDIFVSIGGVSVGDYDIIQDVLKETGLKVDFWKVAIMPGKPIVYGDFNGIPFFGLPGNPSSAYVCFANFVLPAMYKMQGRDQNSFPVSHARLEHDIKAGSKRLNFMRAIYRENERGEKYVNSTLTQSSANLKTLARSNCLLVRDVGAPPANTGDLVKIIIIAP